MSQTEKMHAVFRAVENGFTLVRPAGESGVSISSDPYGRVLSCLDNSYSEDKIMMVDVPIHSVKTIYSTVGDLFAWLAIAGLVMVSSLRKKE